MRLPALLIGLTVGWCLVWLLGAAALAVLNIELNPQAYGPIEGPLMVGTGIVAVGALSWVILDLITGRRST